MIACWDAEPHVETQEKSVDTRDPGDVGDMENIGKILCLRMPRYLWSMSLIRSWWRSCGN